MNDSEGRKQLRAAQQKRMKESSEGKKQVCSFLTYSKDAKENLWLKKLPSFSFNSEEADNASTPTSH